MPASPKCVTVTVDVGGNIAFPMQIAAIGIYVQSANTIGAEANPLPQPATISFVAAYAPIYDSVRAVQRIIGFGFVEVWGTAPGDLHIFRRGSQVAAANPAAVVSGGFPVSGVELSDVVAATKNLDAALPTPVLVP